MDRTLQTDELNLELYRLTRIFTRALQPRYFYQYKGDTDDLASEFYLQFITPKARKGHPKESLLDKFDPNTTSLAYLVKVCVIRKLIDWSRQNPQKYSSIDELMEANGDCIAKAFRLVSEHSEEYSVLDDSRFLVKVVKEFQKLDEDERNKLYVSIFDSQSTLSSVLQPTLRFVRNCPIQQVTDKTVVLYIPEAKKLVNFSLEDGHPRGKFCPFSLSEIELKELRSFGIYTSHFSRELLVEFMSA